MGPFATATELAEWVGVALPSDLARMQALLDSASSLIRSHCGQVLSFVANDSVTLLASSRDTLILPERPVTAVASVTVQGVPLASTAYSWTRAGRLIQSATSSYPYTGNGIAWIYGATVVYSHGYLETDPEFGELRTICIEAAARAYTGDEGGGAASFGGVTAETAGWSPEVFLSDGEKARLMSFGPVGVG